MPAHREGITRSKNLVEIAASRIVSDARQPPEHFDETEMDLEGQTMPQIARPLHIHESSIARAVALLELPETVQDQVIAGTIAPSVAYEVSILPTPEAQTALAERVVSEGLTRAEITKKQSVTFKVGAAKVTITGSDDVVAALKAALKQAQKN